jgi:hypothetical protein
MYGLCSVEGESLWACLSITVYLLGNGSVTPVQRRRGFFRKHGSLAVAAPNTHAIT